MKRSEAAVATAKYISDNVSYYYKNGVTFFKSDAEDLLRYLVDELGMQPPTNTCKLVPDPLRGGEKHSASKREWDTE